MAYNNYFPQSYTNTPYMFNTTQTPQVQLGTINWVQGEAGARSTPVPAGQKAMLMDSETNVFYIKSSDSSGMPLPLRIFEYKEVTNTVPAPTSNTETNDPAPSTYVTHEELEKILSELKQKPKEEKTNEFII